MDLCIPWGALVEGYYQSLSGTQGRPSKDARLVIGAVIIKYKLCLFDEWIDCCSIIGWHNTQSTAGLSVSNDSVLTF
ncbi:MAG TPA: hypothetical protein ENJ13_03200 [Chromatiales bacterium]|nr:hypothetical protein [Chromatiales bacterium]